MRSALVFSRARVGARAFFLPLAAAALVAGLLSPQARAARNDPEWEKLDYAREVRADDIVFVPFKNLTRGVFWFTSYKHNATAPSSFRGLRRVVVSLRPSAHLDGRYDRFVREHRVEDTRSLWLDDAASPCAVSAEALALVDRDAYAPGFMSASYPNLCSVALVYAPEKEAALLRLIDEQKVLTAATEVPLCAPESPKYSAGDLVDALVADDVLEPTSAANEYTGRLARIVLGVHRALAEAESPASELGEEVVESFLDNVIAAVGQGACGASLCATVQVKPELDPQYLCESAPLAISVGP